MRRLVELDQVSVDWGIFSLEINNTKKESAEDAAEFRATLAMRTVMAVRRSAGNVGVGAFYFALGNRIWDDTQDILSPDTIKGALADAGLDTALSDDAMADPTTWDEVVAEHHALVEGTRTFGVPSITLDGGSGPCTFGPVISHMPTDDESVELWHAVKTLTRNANFSELKRDRVDPPDLEAVRARAKK